ncbi:response regulator [Klebsiella pneumoniae]|uniref:Response regulator n=1 Tax=Paenibacillus antri TaxID=2582848 RepID=A0A5R9G7T8_9BACL|nr:response regulator [Paenibacillus antri]TLS50140.1 response regulator [Paenibacillus antri]TMY86611.1 response regulator [Klebsiella pneumoniae]
MSKYIEMFIQQFGQRIRDLLQRDASVSEEELYRLVHTAKGTAGTVGLPEWSTIAGELLALLSEDGSRTFTVAEAELLLAPLLHAASGSVVAATMEAKEIAPAAAEAVRVEGPWKIAVVDDDPILRTMLGRRLSRLISDFDEVNIKLYEDGDAFLADEWHKNEEPCLIVLDRNMPRLNGMEVLRQIRQHDPKRRYSILMLTGIEDDLEVAKALEAGVDDYVTKPFGMAELEARVRKMLQKR